MNARHADKTGERFYHIAGPLVVGIIGFVIAESTMHTAGRYIALFLVRLGLFATPPHDLTLQIDGPILRRIHCVLLVVLQLSAPPAVEACCCACAYQCVFAAWKYCGVVCVADYVGKECE